MNQMVWNFGSCLLLLLAIGVAWANPTGTDEGAGTPAAESKDKSGKGPSMEGDANSRQVSSVDDVVDGIQSFYRDARDLKAEFQQTYTYTQMGRKQSKSGKVFFKKPSRMRWDYKQPVPQVFVSDGSVLWVYQPTDAQVFKQTLKNSQLPVALTFMSGRGELRTEFKAQLIEPSTKADSYTVQLIPKKSEVNYKSVLLTVRKTDFSVLESVVVDPVGNENRLVFKKVVQNTDIPDRAFEFKVPKGVRVIDGEAN
ncbi:MAG: outer membrane lipoprotein chaperone LolA [Myxococcota bacterium]|nr:outer membrane lipoprotein chaperone LolA [Myxococcota bacterium]